MQDIVIPTDFEFLAIRHDQHSTEAVRSRAATVRAQETSRPGPLRKEAPVARPNLPSARNYPAHRSLIKANCRVNRGFRGLVNFRFVVVFRTRSFQFCSAELRCALLFDTLSSAKR